MKGASDLRKSGCFQMRSGDCGASVPPHVDAFDTPQVCLRATGGLDEFSRLMIRTPSQVSSSVNTCVTC